MQDYSINDKKRSSQKEIREKLLDTATLYIVNVFEAKVY